MKTSNVRKGIIQAKFNEDTSTILMVEIGIVCIILGLYFKSWWVLGGCFLAFSIGIHLRFVPIIIAFLFSIIWAFLSACIVNVFYITPDNESRLNPSHWNIWEMLLWIINVFTFTSATVVISLFVFFGALGIHLSAIEFYRDLGDFEDRNF